MMAGVIFGFLSPETQARILLEERAKANRAMASALPWPQARFDKLVGIQASTFAGVVEPHLWPGIRPVGIGRNDVNEAAADQRVDFGRWRYAIRNLPAGSCLSVFQGSRQGRIVFDGDVLVPGIWRKSYDGYGSNPVMSITPMEVWSLSPGVRAAKGHVVVAGLGLGWSLLAISRKRTVNRITLVERDADLLGEVYPRIEPLLGKAEVEVLVDDAERLVPTMKADVAVVDIADDYGSNTFPRCPHVGRVWVWGAANLGEGW